MKEKKTNTEARHREPRDRLYTDLTTMTKEEWDDFLFNLVFWGKFLGTVAVAALVLWMFFL